MRPLLLTVLAFAPVATAADARRAVDKASPSVVRIDAQGRELAPELDSLLRRVGASWSGRRAQRGTGVVLDGDVLTNAHVVQGASTVSVSLGSTTVASRVVAIDADLDLAWIRPDTPVEAPSITWADGADVGAPVFTLGFPTGPDLTVSAGVLSGSTERGLEGRSRRTWLLTDALVQRGASGGPLVDETGAVLGLSTGGHAANTDGLGLGLVLPAEDVRSRWRAWQAERPRQLGVRCRPHDRGLVLDGGGLDEAVVVAVQGTPVHRCRSLGRLVRQHESLVVTVDDTDRRLPTTPLVWGSQTQSGDAVTAVSASGHLRGFDVGDRVAKGPEDAIAVQVVNKGWLVVP